MPKRLTTAQTELLAEIREAGILYIQRYSRWSRTVEVLERHGLIYRAEPDHSTMAQDGWAVREEASDGG